MVSDLDWVRACARLIKQDGAEQFLVNLLDVLRESLNEDLLQELRNSAASAKKKQIHRRGSAAGPYAPVGV
jgi:hypothetical protein